MLDFIDRYFPLIVGASILTPVVIAGTLNIVL